METKVPKGSKKREQIKQLRFCFTLYEPFENTKRSTTQLIS